MDNKDLESALDRLDIEGKNIENMNNAEIIAIITDLVDLDEVTTALTELSIRDKEVAVPHCLKILKEDLGDEFLQAVAFNLLYEVDQEKAKEIISQKLTNSSTALIGAIMDNLSTDSLQPFGESLSSEFLNAILERYFELSDAEKERIHDNYEWFKESFVKKLSIM
ncbi:hypothetical protein HUB98_07195 [Paenibacillus barcinonensis]|uniref:Uncharacterized protein n=1 Tax=Paenibacillus barcinonensis TaxID=198119 RepID=A0A2V4W380_PAEBA|nr:hypothetical protein [Paenibacillus barcinonensis]PYE42104.1 hypothetical protein DFQ00_1445 [Paenibacillus barcinonensis]QKS56150.1 hypothetical protein HUB98_07195 [Paenibacillus barcinonensis]